MTARSLLIFASLGLLLVGADRALEDAERFVRQGNTAFEEGDYVQAVALYTKAEPTTTDPGMVAYNKATALYRLALAEKDESKRIDKMKEAASYYARCEGEEEPRRARALYGRGACLLHATTDAPSLRMAIGCFERCLESKELDRELADNARHNLELAKLFWLKVPPEVRQKQEEENRHEETGSNPSSPNDKKELKPDRNAQTQAGAGDPIKGRKPEELEPGEKPMATDQKPPPAYNAGQKVPDQVPLTPRPAEQAIRDLEEAVRRIKEEQKRNSKKYNKPVEGVQDW